MDKHEKTLMAFCILRHALYTSARFMRKNDPLPDLFDSDYARDDFDLLDGFEASDIEECEDLAHSMFNHIDEWITEFHARDIAAYIESKDKTS